MHGVGFEPTQLTLPGLKSGSLDHSDIRAHSPVKRILLPGGLEPPASAYHYCARFCRIRTAL